MKRWATVLAVSVLVLVSLAVAQQNPPAAAEPPAGPASVIVQAVAPQQWQYDVLQFALPVEQGGANQMRDAFNQRGRQGWELISGVEFNGRATYVFRQPVLPAPGARAR